MMKTTTWRAWRLASLAAVLSARSAHALEPPATFLDGARAASTDNRRALAIERQRGEEAQENLGSVLPSLSASAIAVRNEREVTLTVNGNELNIQPRNQGYGSASVSVPLVDLAGWARYSAARSTAKAARESTRATRLTTEGRVGYAYFQLVGASSLSRARVRSLATSKQNLDLTRSRRGAGTATALDVARAEAEVESVRQKLADANLAAALARRTLLTLTGIEAGGDDGALSDDLHVKPPLAWWEERGRAAPSIAVAAAERASADAEAFVDRLARLSLRGRPAVDAAQGSG